MILPSQDSDSTHKSCCSEVHFNFQHWVEQWRGDIDSRLCSAVSDDPWTDSSNPGATEEKGDESKGRRGRGGEGGDKGRCTWLNISTSDRGLIAH